jgi:hypothetical protein
MKLTLTVQNYNTILRSLQRSGIEIKENFKGQIVDYGKEIRNRAKEILSEESTRRTNKRYWTGRLYDAIESRHVIREDNIVGISVGVDLRDVRYAEWVEIGHYDSWKNWWEGYHYLERAYTEVAPEIPGKIAQTLKTVLRKYQLAGLQVKHRRTGEVLHTFDFVD